MGSGASNKKREIEEIKCSPAVTHQKINEYVDYCPHKCDKCRNVMQKARLIVTEAGKSLRKDLEITCYGEHKSFCFWSGKRRNRIVVQMFEGEIHETTTDRSTWEQLKETLKSNWSGVLRVVVNAAGRIIGAIRGEHADLLTPSALLAALTAFADEIRQN
ncbi:Hypothetical predicted protein [Paramuricea clavata]|uniref:Uncharacterized protein n=1 Tax=Paramuricea clavata TaxID=317549 RepID=A0A6S7IQZ1_PARCT|nr:Hypothetical predicted protein [Paramuricea clavata]